MRTGANRLSQQLSASPEGQLCPARHSPLCGTPGSACPAPAARLCTQHKSGGGRTASAPCPVPLAPLENRLCIRSLQGQAPPRRPGCTLRPGCSQHSRSAAAGASRGGRLRHVCTRDRQQGRLLGHAHMASVNCRPPNQQAASRTTAHGQLLPLSQTHLGTGALLCCSTGRSQVQVRAAAAPSAASPLQARQQPPCAPQQAQHPQPR